MGDEVSAAANEQAEPAGLEAARIDVRDVGFCALCGTFVERARDGRCPKGHPSDAVSGHLVLSPGQPVPHLPRFNWGAFLVPPIWGPAHGVWAGAFFLPIWLFMDSTIVSAQGRGAGSMGMAVLVTVATIAAQAWFAWHANSLAYRRVGARMSVDAYVRRERVWLAAAIPLAVLLVGWAVWFDVAYRPLHPELWER